MPPPSLMGDEGAVLLVMIWPGAFHVNVTLTLRALSPGIETCKSEH